MLKKFIKRQAPLLIFLLAGLLFIAYLQHTRQQATAHLSNVINVLYLPEDLIFTNNDLRDYTQIYDDNYDLALKRDKDVLRITGK